MVSLAPSRRRDPARRARLRLGAIPDLRSRAVASGSAPPGKVGARFRSRRADTASTGWAPRWPPLGKAGARFRSRRADTASTGRAPRRPPPGKVGARFRSRRADTASTGRAPRRPPPREAVAEPRDGRPAGAEGGRSAGMEHNTNVHLIYVNAGRRGPVHLRCRTALKRIAGASGASRSPRIGRRGVMALTPVF
jgi:hypothetical protein